MDEVQATAVAPPRVRRRHSPGFRSEVINAAKQPGTSFSAGCWILGGDGGIRTLDPGFAQMLP